MSRKVLNNTLRTSKYHPFVFIRAWQAHVAYMNSNQVRFVTRPQPPLRNIPSPNEDSPETRAAHTTPAADDTTRSRREGPATAACDPPPLPRMAVTETPHQAAHTPALNTAPITIPPMTDMRRARYSPPVLTELRANTGETTVVPTSTTNGTPYSTPHAQTTVNGGRSQDGNSQSDHRTTGEDGDDAESAVDVYYLHDYSFLIMYEDLTESDEA